ncbi:hypothetical protein AVEN_49190-1 [Araneus ventricosus]|uniref:CCHC-type domain-containing protein n=1 Tax=Araneus ventricosus TaxID=182803 RepID=A0A4Y1ZSI6_ARAVE|nr:hypothetical protein AVEN_49190-1 [Araneus ventricosus]
MRFATIFRMRSQLKNPEEFARKLGDFENVRADKRITETCWRDYPGRRYSDEYEVRRNVTNHEFRSSPIKDEKYRVPRREQHSASINTRKDCYICGLSHLARDCPERFHVSTPNPKELNEETDVPTAEIQSYRLKPEKSSHLPVNIPINALQYATTIVGEKEVKSLIDSRAQIPAINGRFLSQRK